MKKIIALTALSAVLGFASVGAFAQGGPSRGGPVASKQHPHHAHHKHHRHHKHARAVRHAR